MGRRVRLSVSGGWMMGRGQNLIRNCIGFKVKITKYQLMKQIGLVLNKSRQYNILGFHLNMPSIPKSFRDFRARVLQKIRFLFHHFDSS